VYASVGDMTMATDFSNLKIAANELFDRCRNELESIKSEMNRDASNNLSPALAAVSHNQATRLQTLVSENVTSDDLRKLLLSWLHTHQWHKNFLLESHFIAHALTKPRGYAGDAELMDMICKNDDRGNTPFAVAKTRVYLDLPAAIAVRLRAKALARYLERLPEGARVLNLACGPALEVKEFLSRNPQRDIRFLLLDHDPTTINALRQSGHDSRYEAGLANAFQIMKGNPTLLVPRSKQAECVHAHHFEGWRRILVPFKYRRLNLTAMPQFDLVYSSGLFDYVRHTANNPMRGPVGLTTQLFGLVKPEGQLLIGNFRTPGISGNPHAKHHMTMMDMYSDWRLIYRSDDEIMGFTSGLPQESVASALLNEELNSISHGGAIGFLRAQRLQ
jgi:hypothetical protein